MKKSIILNYLATFLIIFLVKIEAKTKLHSQMDYITENMDLKAIDFIFTRQVNQEDLKIVRKFVQNKMISWKVLKIENNTVFFSNREDCFLITSFLLQMNSASKLGVYKPCWVFKSRESQLNIKINQQIYFLNNQEEVFEIYTIGNFTINRNLGIPNYFIMETFLQRRSNFMGLKLKGAVANQIPNVLVTKSEKIPGHENFDKVIAAEGFFVDLTQSLAMDLNVTFDIFHRKNDDFGQPFLNGVSF